MRRRGLIVGALAAGVARGAAAQSERARRVGVLTGLAEDDPGTTAQLAAFRDGLAALGWSEGRNLRIETRFGAGLVADPAGRVAELLALNPDVLVVHAPGVPAAVAATRSVPIVFVGGVDPVGRGWVDSYARPGGNLTGFTSSEPSFGPKWLELLKQIAPTVRRVAVLGRMSAWGIRIAAVAERFAVEIVVPPVQSPADIEAAVTALAERPDGGLITPDDAWISSHSKPIVEMAMRYRLPLVSGTQIFVRDGGLLYFGAGYVDLYRRSAAYADRILRGGKPSDLPVQQPTTFNLVINLKTAEALGLSVPPSLLVQATEIIE